MRRKRDKGICKTIYTYCRSGDSPVRYGTQEFWREEMAETKEIFPLN